MTLSICKKPLTNTKELYMVLLDADALTFKGFI